MFFSLTINLCFHSINLNKCSSATAQLGPGYRPDSVNMISNAKAYSRMLCTMPNPPQFIHWLIAWNLPDALKLFSTSEAEFQSIAKLKSPPFREKPRLQGSHFAGTPGKKLGCSREFENGKVCSLSSNACRMMLIGFLGIVAGAEDKSF